MGVVDGRRFELSLLQLAGQRGSASATGVREEGRQGRAGGGAARRACVCRNVAVATTLWNLLEAVSVVDDDECEGLAVAVLSRAFGEEEEGLSPWRHHRRRASCLLL